MLEKVTLCNVLTNQTEFYPGPKMSGSHDGTPISFEISFFFVKTAVAVYKGTVQGP